MTVNSAALYMIVCFIIDSFGFEKTLYPISEADEEVEVCVVSRGPALQEQVAVQMVTIEGSGKSKNNTRLRAFTPRHLLSTLSFIEGIDFSPIITNLAFSKNLDKVCTSIPILNDPQAEKVKYFYPFLTRLGLGPGVRLYPDITNVMLEDNDGKHELRSQLAWVVII